MGDYILKKAEEYPMIKTTNKARIGGEIVVTDAMIEAGVDEFSQHRMCDDIKYVLESVFRAMSYSSLRASLISASK